MATFRIGSAGRAKPNTRTVSRSALERASPRPFAPTEHFTSFQLRCSLLNANLQLVVAFFNLLLGALKIGYVESDAMK